MKTKPLQITLEQAKQLHKQGGPLAEAALEAFPELKPQLVKSWNESIDLRQAFFLGGNRPAFGCKYEGVKKQFFRTEAQAKSALAFAQLSHIVAEANGDWERRISCAIQDTFTIIPCEDDELKIHQTYYEHSFLPMKSAEIARACLDMHPQLWKDFHMIED